MIWSPYETAAPLCYALMTHPVTPQQCCNTLKHTTPATIMVFISHLRNLLSAVILVPVQRAHLQGENEMQMSVLALGSVKEGAFGRGSGSWLLWFLGFSPSMLSACSCQLVQCHTFLTFITGPLSWRAGTVKYSSPLLPLALSDWARGGWWRG